VDTVPPVQVVERRSQAGPALGSRRCQVRDQQRGGDPVLVAHRIAHAHP